MAIRRNYESMISANRLNVQSAFITAENIQSLLKAANVPAELDLLSIDIDGNDYWVWKAITDYRPRVVVIEYNATFRYDTEFIQSYDPKRLWNRTSYYGVSLKSLELLGRSKGYSLVGCNFIGSNAFFVRDDIRGEKFMAPYTAETHYEPPRYWIWRKVGHPRGFWPFTVDSPS